MAPRLNSAERGNGVKNACRWRSKHAVDYWTFSGYAADLGNNDGMMLSPFALYIYFVLIAPFVCAQSSYYELLTLKPLPLGTILASFDFRSNQSYESFQNQGFSLFPRSLGQILQHANARELHIRFTTGRWDPETWGSRPWNGYKEGGTGVELWAWIEATSEES